MHFSLFCQRPTQRILSPRSRNSLNLDSPRASISIHDPSIHPAEGRSPTLHVANLYCTAYASTFPLHYIHRAVLVDAFTAKLEAPRPTAEIELVW